MALERFGRPELLLAAVACLVLGANGAEAQQFSCPKKGGEFVFAQEAKVNSLDMHTSSAISTRNIALNLFESLMTRDENFNLMPELAQAVEESKDGKTYVFRLRQGIKFHNGKPMTSADVAASYARYKQFGIDRGLLDVVDKWETPDAQTFVMSLKAPQPTFLENLSSFLAPIVIVPEESTKAPAMQLEPIGTGPWQFVEFVADSHVKLKRYDATKSLDRLKQNKAVALKPLKNFWIQLAEVNAGAPPTDNLKFRQAAQAALDMDEIMEAASDGAYQLNIGLQYPGQAAYSEAGKETYNQKNPAKAKQLLAEAGYKGEEMILLTNRDYTSMYNAALVMSEQLKAVGINAKLQVLDWPAATQMFEKTNTGWNFFFDAYGNNPVIGPISSVRKYAPPTNIYKPKTPDDVDKVFNAAFDDMVNGATPEIRKAAFARAQARLLEQVLIVPFGSLTKVQAVRSNVENFRPYRIPRISNVYFSG